MKELSESMGVSGFESEIKKVIKKFAEGNYDEMKEDALGNLIFKVGNGNIRVLIDAHMDEVGILVKYIDEKGFVYFSPLGGLDPHTLISQRFTLKTLSGKILHAVCGTKPVHLLEEDENGKIKIKDLYLDFGVKEKKDIEKLGIQPGDVLVYDRNLEKINNDFITGKALDNRIGCYAALELMRKIKNDQEILSKYTFYFVFTTQEEVGLKGARVAGFSEEVDYAVVLDSSPAGDTPGIEAKISDLKLGGGVIIDFIQAEGRGLIMKKEHLEKIKRIFDKHNIPYQIEIGVGGVSNAAIIYISRQGIPTIGLGIAIRYLHTPIEVANIKDIDNLVEGTYLLLKEGIFE